MPDVISVATLLGVLAAVLQLHALHAQRQQDFEDSFAQRYWKIMDDLSLDALKCRRSSDGRAQPEDEKAVIAFLRLSEDELDLRAQRSISRSTWKMWWDGMRTQLHRWPFDEVWAEVCKSEGRAGDNAQFKHLRRVQEQIEQMADYDPPSVWWFTPRLGLRRKDR